jgi:hypothetical protein
MAEFYAMIKYRTLRRRIEQRIARARDFLAGLGVRVSS